jgi:hypothetical protein
MTREEGMLSVVYKPLKRHLVVLVSWAFIAAVVPSALGNSDEILNTPLSSFVREKTAVGNIAMGLATELSIPIGFEGLPEDPERDVTISATNTNLRTLLNDIIRADPRYEWSIADDSIIDMYPRDKRERFLDVIIPHFRVDSETRNVALDQLTKTTTFARLLTSLNARLHTPFAGPPDSNQSGPKISIDLQNASVRRILNAIVISSHGVGWSAVR